MRYIAALLLLIIAVAVSCTKKKSNYKVSGDYMIIGRAGGFTTSDAQTTYYLISNGELRADKTVRSVGPPSDINVFNFSEVLSKAKYDSVRRLPSMIPAELLASNNQAIGDVFPDAGYTDVRTSISGTVYQWKFEADQSGSSTAIQQFLDSVNVVFE